MAEIIVNNKWVPFRSASPNQRADTDGEIPRFIILHSTGGSFASAVSWLLQKASGVSAHFVVSRAGEIRQLVSIKRIAYHAGKSAWGTRTNLNDCSIGIELAHVDGKEDWPEAQVKAAAELAKTLRHRFGIPVQKILGHSEVAPGRKVDPVGFPWERFRKMVL